MIRLRTWPAVPEYIRQSTRKMLRRLPEIVEIRHIVRVKLIPAVLWLDEETFDEYGGRFLQPGSGGEPCIIVGGLPYCVKQQRWLEGDAAVRLVQRFTLHEIAHYEQFRDGKRLIERGVWKRADELLAELDRRGMR